MRKAVAAVIAIAALLGLSACESTLPIPTPSPSAIVGTWRHGSDVLIFNADGSFTATDIPLGVVEQAAVALGASPSGPDVAVSGTWSIGTGGTDAGGAPGVQLEFVHPQKVGPDYGLTLIVSNAIPPKLYVNLGHPDASIRYSFKKS